MSKLSLCSLALILAAPLSAGSALADSPFNKTFTGSAQVCFTRTGQCTQVVPIHVFLSQAGRLYSFLRESGGQVFKLGEFISFGGVQERFIVKGSTLVFEAVSTDQNGSRLTLRGFMRAQQGACSISASAIRDGSPEPTTLAASCQVTDGQS